MGKKTTALLLELDELKQFESKIIERVWNESPDAVDLKGIFLTQEHIKARVELLADQLIKDYPNANPVLVGLMDGATPFANLLCTALDKKKYPYNYTTMSVSSYGNELVSGSVVKTGNLPKVELINETVIVLDDVCDTGKTLKTIANQFLRLLPKTVKLMTLVDKVQERPEGRNPDYVGFSLSKDAFIIGMGLDYRQGLRNKNSIKAANPKSLPTVEEDLLLKRKDEIIAELKVKIALRAEKEKTKLTSPGQNSIFALSLEIVPSPTVDESLDSMQRKPVVEAETIGLNI